MAAAGSGEARTGAASEGEGQGQGVKFPFPFEPYPVQQQLMERILRVLESGPGAVGLFESPTGTGKSLSIIVATLHWLLDRMPARAEAEELQRREEEALRGLAADEPEWVRREVRRQVAATLRVEREERRQRIERIRARVLAAGSGSESSPRRKRARAADEGDAAASDKELEKRREEEAEGEGEKEEEEEEEEEWSEHPKIIYCSRTHSQLSQFVGEIKRTVFRERVRCASLASRRHLCVNPRVLALRSATRINDACLDMQKDTATRCPYLTPGGQRALRDLIVSRLHTLEEIEALSKRRDACGYYGTRKAVQLAHLVAMPYSSLLHAATRESLGVSVEGNVVVLDEAHNLPDALCRLHSVRLSRAVLELSYAQLQAYFATYRARLADRNRVPIEELLKVHACLLGVLEAASAGATARRAMLSVDAFLLDDAVRSRMDNINIFALCTFIDAFELPRKLLGFAATTAGVAATTTATSASTASPSASTAATEPEVVIHASGGEGGGEDAAAGGEDAADTMSRHASPLGRVRDLLHALRERSESGRILLYRGVAGEEDRIEYLQLDASVGLRSVLAGARAVLFVGGTLQPFDLFLRQVAPLAAPERVHTFACGHVVPPENVVAVTLRAGAVDRTRPLRFTHEERVARGAALAEEARRIIANVAEVAPDGVVVFFTSYAAEKEVMDGEFAAHLTRLAGKRVFRESRGGAAHATLAQYEEAIRSRNGRGALLSAVMGGKLSEGINFADALARCVIVVGLPYPNPHDPELVERKAFLAAAGGREVGERYYENLCMRAVNQSIGRAIRHARDFAAMVLVDERFTGKADALPGWIRARVVHAPDLGRCKRALAEFFRVDRAAKV